QSGAPPSDGDVFDLIGSAAAPRTITELMGKVMGRRRPEENLKVHDFLFMALTVSSGAIDAVSYLALSKVFTAFMTGNLVFLGLRMSGAGGFNIVRVILALVFFSAGSVVSARIVSFARESAEGSAAWPRGITAALGAVVTAHAVFLVIWMAVGGWPTGGV